MSTDPYAPPITPAEPEPKRRNLWLWGCGGLLGMFLLVLAGCGLLFKRGVDVSEPRARLYLQDWSNQRYEECYRAHADAWKAKDDRAAYRRFAEPMHRILGPVLSFERQGMFLNYLNGRKLATYHYRAHFKQGEGVVIIQVVEEHADWRVMGINFNSELLAEALKCPDCGSQNQTFVPHCGQCGKPLPALVL